MASGVLNLLRGVRDLLYPPKCSVCRELLPWRVPTARPYAAEALCKRCLSLWEEATEEKCSICGSAVRECLCMPSLIKDAKCSAFCKAVYYVPHEGNPVQNRLVYHIKDHNDSKAFRFLAAQLVPEVSRLLDAEGITREECLITYAPRGRRAYIETGVDQSKALARCLGILLDMKCKALIGRDPKSNTPQKTLTPAERQRNAQKAFFPLTRERVCLGKTVLLVDDVMTTGASMARCARLLRKMGALRVYCVCVAADRVNRDDCVRSDG